VEGRERRVVNTREADDFMHFGLYLNSLHFILQTSVKRHYTIRNCPFVFYKEQKDDLLDKWFLNAIIDIS
jgi:hypothetical protein